MHDWLTDNDEQTRLPRRLHDLVGLAYDEYAGLAGWRPNLLETTGATPLQLADGRAVDHRRPPLRCCLHLHQRSEYLAIAHYFRPS